MLTPGRLAIVTSNRGISPLIQFIGAGVMAADASQGGTVNIPWPAGYSPVSGDIAIIVAVGKVSVAQSSATDAPEPTGGFTRLATRWQGTAVQTTVFYKVLNGTESVPTFTNLTDTTPSPTIYGTLGIGYTSAIFRGVDQTNPIDTAAVTSGGQTPSTGIISFTPTGVGTTNINSLAISVVGINDDADLILRTTKDYSTAFSGPQYSTELGSDFGMGLAYKFVRDPSSSSTVEIPTWLQTFSSFDQWAAISFSLRGAPFSGSIDESQENQTLDGAGIVPYTGSLNKTQENNYLTAVGDFSIRSFLSETQDNQTLEADGLLGWKILAESIDGSGAIEGVNGTPNVPGADVLILEDQYFYIDTSDSRIAPLGPESITLFDPVNPPPPYTPRVSARLVGVDGKTVISNLENSFGIEWRDALNEHGFGKISIPSSEADAALLIPGRYVQCLLDGVPRFLWMIESQPERVVISSGEESEEVVTAQGRGWIAHLDYALVYPEGGTSNPLNPQHRLFSFASPQYPNLTGWRSSSIVEGRAGSLLPPRTVVSSEEIAEPAPAGFPDPNAMWIWGTSKPHRVGRCYFRRYFTNPKTQELRFVGSADNFFTVFLNGVPIFGENSEGLGWQGYKEVVLLLPAGTYLIGIVGENIPGDGGFNNPAGVLLSIFPNNQPIPVNPPAYPGHPPKIVMGMRSSNVGLVQSRLNQLGFNSGPVDNYFGPITDGAVRAFQRLYAPPVDGWVGPITWAALFQRSSSGIVGKVLATDSSFTSLAYPITDPGWTPGQIIDRLLIDAYGRSAALYSISTYSARYDSAGRAWSSDPNGWSFVPGFSVPVGSTVLSAIDTLAEAGWVDYRLKPGAKAFDMFNANRVGQTKNVVYQKNVNIKSLTYDIGDPRINRIVVKWSGGWVIVNNSADIAANGAYERFLTVDTEDYGEAVRQARLNLSQLSDPQHSIVVEIEPRNNFNETPYKNFFIGDKVYAPSPTNVSTAYRVVGIAVQQDDMGDPLFTLELNRRSRIIERQQFDLLQTLSGGVAGPNSTRTLESSNPTSFTVRNIV